jgi:hypothetical protein
MLGCAMRASVQLQARSLAFAFGHLDFSLELHPEMRGAHAGHVGAFLRMVTPLAPAVVAHLRFALSLVRTDGGDSGLNIFKCEWRMMWSVANPFVLPFSPLPLSPTLSPTLSLFVSVTVYLPLSLQALSRA